MLNFTIYDYPVVGSTNDEVKLLLTQGAAEGTVVRAQRQTAGRGRRGRPWISEPGNLYCSLLLTPRCPLTQANQLSFVMAVAVGQTILPFLTSPEVLSYKWPNDLLLQKAKVAGILIETESERGQLTEACVVGIGININVVPDHPVYLVTALNQHTELNLIQDVLFSALLDQIKHYYDVWQQEGFAPIREAWKKRAHGLGQNMIVRIGNQEMSGQFVDISPEGELLLKKQDGSISALMSAEILAA